MSSSELAYNEFGVMGLFLKNHPLTELEGSLTKCHVKTSAYIKNELEEGQHRLKLSGVITKKDARMSKRGRFVTLLLSDPHGIFEVTIYNECPDRQTQKYQQKPFPQLCSSILRLHPTHHRTGLLGRR